MPSARDVVLRVVDAATAGACVKRWHYSRKHIQNSQVHFGAFLGDACHGVLSFGPPMDRRKVLGLVAGTAWDGMLELNRMAFGPLLPRNSESRCLAISCRLLAKHYPQLEWVLSFADGVQCGDGTIYRAAGWVLTGVAASSQIMRDKAGQVWTRMSVTEAGSASRRRALVSIGSSSVDDLRSSSLRPFIDAGWQVVPGHMMRYIKPLRDGVVERLTVPVLPYSAIDAAGARMVRGKRVASIGDAPADQAGESGSNQEPRSNTGRGHD